jgi:hypothetical protein
MILKGLGFVAFFASVEASSICIQKRECKCVNIFDLFVLVVFGYGKET